jgi:hypothetical protein
MRVCILCEESKVKEVRLKNNNNNILNIDLSPTGELPSTHKLCVIALPDEQAIELINSAKLTIIEAMNPTAFLEKHNLKKIGKYGIL